jgi:hypothetical protein
MPEIGHYRNEARRCRAMARVAKTVEVARRWHELADEYELLAVALERSGRPSGLHAPMQMQPMQQQQSKAKDPK